MGHSLPADRTRTRSVGLRLACAFAAFFSTVGVVAAEGATHHYCVGCTIYSNSQKIDPTAHYITLDYVHRLSGPGSGVTIGARAKYVSDGSWGSYVYSTSTEVQHGYNGTRNAWGAATNFGAGNYGFNAHVNY